MVRRRVKDSLENGDESLLQNDSVKEVLQRKQASWRRAASLAFIVGVPAPVMQASLEYFDAMRRDKLSQSLVIVGEGKSDDG